MTSETTERKPQSEWAKNELRDWMLEQGEGYVTLHEYGGKGCPLLVTCYVPSKGQTHCRFGAVGQRATIDDLCKATLWLCEELRIPVPWRTDDAPPAVTAAEWFARKQREFAGDPEYEDELARITEAAIANEKRRNDAPPAEDEGEWSEPVGGMIALRCYLVAGKYLGGVVSVISLAHYKVGVWLGGYDTEDETDPYCNAALETVAEAAQSALRGLACDLERYDEDTDRIWLGDLADMPLSAEDEDEGEEDE